MKRENFFVLVMAMALLLTACGGNSTSAGGNQAAPSSSAATADMAEWGASDSFYSSTDTAPMEPAPAGGEENGSSPVYRDENAKLIRRAYLDVQTESFDQAAAALNQLVNSCGGYFERASVEGGSLRDTRASRYGQYTIRLPAQRYDSFLSQTGELGYVSSRSETSEDIGEQYYDTQARLKTQRTKQDRLLELLAKADTMEGIVALENALSDVEYQIEYLTSTLNRYDSLVSYSTIELNLQEVRKVQEEVGEANSLGTRMGAGFASSLEGLVQGFQNLLVFLSYNFFPLVILAAVAGTGIAVARRRAGKWRRANKSGKDQNSGT